MQLNEFMQRLEELTVGASQIDKELFETYNVKRGLRNQDGSGVLVGLTNVGEVIGYEKKDGIVIPGRENFFTGVLMWKTLFMGFKPTRGMALTRRFIYCLPGNCQTKAIWTFSQLTLPVTGIFRTSL